MLLELADNETSLNPNARQERVKKCSSSADHIDEKYLANVCEQLNPTLNTQAQGAEAQG